MTAAFGGCGDGGNEGPRVDERIRVGEAPPDVATGYGAVWLVNNEVLQKIDPERNAVTDTLKVGTGLTDVAVGYGAVWVTASLDNEVVRVEP